LSGPPPGLPLSPGSAPSCRKPGHGGCAGRPRVQGRGVACGLLLFALLDWPAALRAEGDGKDRPKFVEPIITEETLPNEPRETSLRVSADYRRHAGEFSGSLPALTLFHGLAERLGASLSLPVAYRRSDGRTVQGLGDVALGMKYVLIEPGSGSSALVLGFEATMPTGDAHRELGEGTHEIEPFLALLRDFGPLCLQGNFGWSKQLGGDRRERFTYNWAVSSPLLEGRLHLLLELNGDAGPSHPSSISPGLKWNLSEDAFAAIATPIGLNDGAPDWGVVVQFKVGF
jgi:hypothetical protein